LRIAVDGFERVAARHGRGAAGRHLAEVGERIRAALRPRHLLARRDAGSVEVLLVEGGEDGAREALDTLGRALDREAFRALGDGGARPRFRFSSVVFPRDGAAASLLLAALDRTAGEHAAVAPAAPVTLDLSVPPHLEGLVAAGPTMRATLEVVARVAPAHTTVLLSGETGAGKEVLADLIQANSDRRDRPYIKINCAAVPETLLETELFGHERGAFTGADRRRIGVFEAADGGTLLLDEIGDLAPATQVKLLRVLQDRTLTRVGGSRCIAVDVRILAATHRDLAEAVRQRSFREDLYYRLNVIEIEVPPLRERREEIPGLIDRFRRRFNREHGLRIAAFAPDALDALHAHPWPGNVRELRNVVERAMVLADGACVERRHLEPGEPGAVPAAPHRPVRGLSPRQQRILRRALGAGAVANHDVVHAETVSPRTALRDLQALVEAGHLVRVGRRRGAVYRPAE
ncbi:MAG: sigma 54-interacting transcriptional regulator, partial [Planctomycetota bacterium]